MLGALLFCYVYVYYYTYGGDTFYYYTIAQPVVDAFRASPITGLKFLLISPGTYTIDTFPYASEMWGFFRSGQEASIQMGRIVGVLEAYSFRSYWLTSLIISALSMTGLWQFFRLFSSMAPKGSNLRLLALACFYIPSVLFWGSGIMKDTICIGLLGWVAYGGERLTKNPKEGLKYIPIILFSSYNIFVLKSYILISYLPVFGLILFTQKITNSHIKALRKLTAPITGSIMAGAFLVATIQLSNASKYSVDNLDRQIQGFHSYHTALAKQQGQSYYSLGNVSYTPMGILAYTPMGILAKAPAAINVTYFRPYVWEVNEPLQYLSAFESFLTLGIFIFITLKHGFFRVLRKLFSGQLLPYTVFVLFFGLSVGITAYNFGALVRFKIPGYLVLANILALTHLQLSHESKEAYNASTSPTKR
jgi:hypothetical protein